MFHFQILSNWLKLFINSKLPARLLMISFKFKTALEVIGSGRNQHHVGGQYMLAGTECQADHLEHGLCNDHCSGQSALNEKKNN